MNIKIFLLCIFLFGCKSQWQESRWNVGDTVCPIGTDVKLTVTEIYNANQYYVTISKAGIRDNYSEHQLMTCTA